VEGKYVMTIPANFGVGVQLMPTERFTFLLSYELHPNGDAEVPRTPLGTYSLGDMQNWIDQSIIQFGMRYRLHDNIHLNALYRSEPMSYVPDGSAIKDSGPEAVLYRIGAEISLGALGAIDLGASFQDLKYQDNYFSNTNYAREKTTVFSLSYIYSIK